MGKFERHVTHMNHLANEDCSRGLMCGLKLLSAHMEKFPTIAIANFCMHDEPRKSNLHGCEDRGLELSHNSNDLCRKDKQLWRVLAYTGHTTINLCGAAPSRAGLFRVQGLL
jgi:hypothetical protein